ncbi:MAG TPA: glutamate--tRNA ligase [Candidatus Sumerlaeota bacterium]|nr:glutamate--tRNA ligase [Candidatus Sumerlaeota bacterium]
MCSIRVRFAPSPTGYLHIGGARTALFNWLYARSRGGVFILRIEDTDLERSTDEAAGQIIESMNWLGLNYDEGPFFQSRRLDLYRKVAAELMQTGHVYKCFCSKERIEKMREEAQREKRDVVYDNHCRNLSAGEIALRESAGEPAVLRFRVPEQGETIINDAIVRETRFDNALIGDFVIMRPDGLPTYNFCVVVDDVDMRITDVIRGIGHLSNTPKQVHIYEALKAPLPRFAHVAHILGPDRQKLSKRHGATSVMEYATEGFFPEALFNFLALLGWSPGTDEEVMSVKRILEVFDLSGINRADSIFDIEKLRWMNGMYMRSLPHETVIERSRAFLPNAGIPVQDHDPAWINGLIELLIERSRTLSEMAPQMRYFFCDDFAFSEADVKKVLKKGPVSGLLEQVREALNGAGDFSVKGLEEPMRALIERLNIGFGQIAQPVRLALTGGLASPGLFEVMHFLGKDQCVRRLDRAAAFFREAEKPQS